MSELDTFVAFSGCNFFSAPALFEAKQRQSSHDGVDQEVESGLTAAAPGHDLRNQPSNHFPSKRDESSVPTIQDVGSAVIGDVRPDVEPRRHSNPEDKTDEYHLNSQKTNSNNHTEIHNTRTKHNGSQVSIVYHSTLYLWLTSVQVFQHLTGFQSLKARHG